MTARMRLVIVACTIALLAAVPAGAQARPSVPLEGFIQQVAWLWNMGDVSAVVDLLPRRDRIILDVGSGTQTVQPRHAAAALRALFDARETGAARAVNVTMAGGDPPRGFGELAWSFRPRNAPSSVTRSVFVGAVWQDGAWRINELRLVP